MKNEEIEKRIKRLELLEKQSNCNHKWYTQSNWNYFQCTKCSKIDK